MELAESADEVGEVGEVLEGVEREGAVLHRGLHMLRGLETCAVGLGAECGFVEDAAVLLIALEAFDGADEDFLGCRGVYGDCEDLRIKAEVGEKFFLVGRYGEVVLLGGFRELCEVEAVGRGVLVGHRIHQLDEPSVELEIPGRDGVLLDAGVGVALVGVRGLVVGSPADNPECAGVVVDFEHGVHFFEEAHRVEAAGAEVKVADEVDGFLKVDCAVSIKVRRKGVNHAYK